MPPGAAQSFQQSATAAAIRFRPGSASASSGGRTGRGGDRAEPGSTLDLVGSRSLRRVAISAPDRSRRIARGRSAPGPVRRTLSQRSRSRADQASASISSPPSRHMLLVAGLGDLVAIRPQAITFTARRPHYPCPVPAAATPRLGRRRPAGCRAAGSRRATGAVRRGRRPHRSWTSRGSDGRKIFSPRHVAPLPSRLLRVLGSAAALRRPSGSRKRERDPSAAAGM